MPLGGCMDRNSANYNENATFDDGSCEPYGTIRFVLVGDYYYNFFVDGNSYYYWNAKINTGISPMPTNCKSECKQCQEYVVGVGTHTYQVVRHNSNLDDTVVQSGTVTLVDGGCEIIKATK